MRLKETTLVVQRGKASHPARGRRTVLGMSATDLVLTLPRVIPALESLTFHTYVVSDGLEERLAGSRDRSLRRIFRQADEIRRITGTDLPYWESVLAASWPTSFDLLIRETLKHDSKREISKRREVPVGDLTSSYLLSTIHDLKRTEVLALCSKCRLRDGSVGHIPMMDFRCSPSSRNLKRTRLAVKAIRNGKGVIVESGRSYHFYGFSILDGDGWLRFLARGLLLAPFTDARYIAHRMLDGTCALRISSARGKPCVPFVAGIL